MAEIEVGGDSELSKHLLKDVVDDSILAAESAYNHGYILGCNVTTIIAIEELLNEYLNKDIDPAIKLIKISILNILHKGFVSVYSQVLENGWGDITINLDPNVYINSNLVDICNEMIKSINKYMNTETGMDPVKFSEIFNKLVGKTQEEYKEWSKSLKDGEELKPIAMSVNMILICYSEYTNQVFDLVEKRFSDRIINSTNTDIQVLTASMDLLSILVNGNQLVLTIKDNF
jgi:chaperonin GroEL (HSP60 family)